MGATHGATTVAAWNGHNLGEVTAIGDVDISADTVDASIYNDPDKFKKYLLGYMDAGEIPITCNFDVSDTDGQIAYTTDFYAQTARTLTITLPTSMGVVWSIPALPVGMSTATPREDKVAITIRVKPTGKPTLTTATSAGLTTTFFSISESAVIVPTPANDVYEYVATVLAGVTSVTVTPIATAGVITVNGNVVATGEASSAITLGAAGSVTEITIVVTETSKAPVTYTIWVARAAS